MRKPLTLNDILDKLDESGDYSDEDDMFGDGTKSIDVTMMPPLPMEESHDSAGDSDDSDSLLGNVGNLVIRQSPQTHSCAHVELSF